MIALIETYFLIVGTANFGVTLDSDCLSLSGQLLLAHREFTSVKEEAIGLTRHFLE